MSCKHQQIPFLVLLNNRLVGSLQKEPGTPEM